MPKGRRKTLKGPRAWRKIDISDITDGARQKTDDMLAGGAIAEKPSSALFTVEKKKAPRTSSSQLCAFCSTGALLLVFHPLGGYRRDATIPLVSLSAKCIQFNLNDLQN